MTIDDGEARTASDATVEPTHDPAAKSGEDRAAKHAIVEAAWVAVRADPGHRSELVSQWLCGETLTVVGRKGGWLRTRGPDGYEGWCSEGGVRTCDRETARAWRKAASARSLGVGIELPFGAPVVAEADGTLRLPSRRRVPDPGGGSVVTEEERGERFPPDGEAVIRTAGLWRGTPYLWGGRLPSGADCSGFVQAVFGLHGVELPRDSGLQMEAGPAVGGADWEPDARRPGDLLFFRSVGADAVTHVAVSLGGTEIVHVADPRGGFARDDLADLPASLAGLEGRIVGVTRPLEA